MTDALFESHLRSLELLNRGKVRDIYAVDDAHMLIVTTDRLSAFDVVLPQPIPGKGEVLTNVSNFWFGRTQHLVPNHLADIPLEQVVPDEVERRSLGARAIVARRLQPLPVEAIVRGYIIGSGWKDYQRGGDVCGIPLPAGLRLADRLPEPIYTPSTKARVGDHDENVNFEHTVALIGAELADRIRELSLRIYVEAAAYALTRDIIIADTKFEFGIDGDGALYLIDEALTPDSSRFWPVDGYEPGRTQASFDKQYVREYLEGLVESGAWDKAAPGPELPDDVVAGTLERYRAAAERLTGG
jgi:phosphoribosylaminoimidazole-succinocarboxamide synthase